MYWKINTKLSAAEHHHPHRQDTHFDGATHTACQPHNPSCTVADAGYPVECAIKPCAVVLIERTNLCVCVCVCFVQLQGQWPLAATTSTYLNCCICNTLRLSSFYVLA